MAPQSETSSFLFPKIAEAVLRHRSRTLWIVAICMVLGIARYYIAWQESAHYVLRGEFHLIGDQRSVVREVVLSQHFLELIQKKTDGKVKPFAIDTLRRRLNVPSRLESNDVVSFVELKYPSESEGKIILEEILDALPQGLDFVMQIPGAWATLMPLPKNEFWSATQYWEYILADLKIMTCIEGNRNLDFSKKQKFTVGCQYPSVANRQGTLYEWNVPLAASCYKDGALPYLVLTGPSAEGNEKFSELIRKCYSEQDSKELMSRLRAPVIWIESRLPFYSELSPLGNLRQLLTDDNFTRLQAMIKGFHLNTSNFFQLMGSESGGASSLAGADPYFIVPIRLLSSDDKATKEIGNFLVQSLKRHPDVRNAKFRTLTLGTFSGEKIAWDEKDYPTMSRRLSAAYDYEILGRSTSERVRKPRLSLMATLILFAGIGLLIAVAWNFIKESLYEFSVTKAKSSQ